MAGEDVEDQLRAIDHTGPHHLLDVALLGRREIVIEQD